MYKLHQIYSMVLFHPNLLRALPSLPQPSSMNLTVCFWRSNKGGNRRQDCWGKKSFESPPHSESFRSFLKTQQNFITVFYGRPKQYEMQKICGVLRVHWRTPPELLLITCRIRPINSRDYVIVCDAACNCVLYSVLNSLCLWMFQMRNSEVRVFHCLLCV